MKYVGKKGDFVYYRQKGIPKELLVHLPEYNSDHIIAGGAALYLLDHSFGLKDIDIWVSGEIPKDATKESQYAFNFQKPRGANVQYMKVKASIPSKLIEAFDLSICKIAVYNITKESYMLCMHKHLQPLVYGDDFTGKVHVNPESFNPYSLPRMFKYANKFKRNPIDMYEPEDYARALGYHHFRDRTVEEILASIGTFSTDNPSADQYELIAHLEELFYDQNASVTFNMEAFTDTVSIHRSNTSMTNMLRSTVDDIFTNPRHTMYSSTRDEWADFLNTL